MKKLDVISDFWQSERAGRRQRAWKLASLCLHAGLICLAWAAASTVPLTQVPTERYTLTMEYAPPNFVKRPAAISHSKVGSMGSIRVAGADMDLAGIRLAIRDDPGFELLAVLSRHNGFMGFADLQAPGYVTHLFRSPDWRPCGQGYTSIEEFFTIRITEPERWPLVRSLQNSNHIPPGALVFGLFPASFRLQIDSAIRAEVLGQIGQGRVREALISFSAKSPAGFVVENVTLE